MSNHTTVLGLPIGPSWSPATFWNNAALCWSTELLAGLQGGSIKANWTWCRKVVWIRCDPSNTRESCYRVRTLWLHCNNIFNVIHISVSGFNVMPDQCTSNVTLKYILYILTVCKMSVMMLFYVALFRINGKNNSYLNTNTKMWNKTLCKEGFWQHYELLHNDSKTIFFWKKKLIRHMSSFIFQFP